MHSGCRRRSCRAATHSALKIDYMCHQPIDAPVFGVAVEREDGVDCYESNSVADRLEPGQLSGRGRLALSIDRLDLNGGTFRVSVGAYQRDWAYAYDYHWRAYSFDVQPNPCEKGILRPPGRWEMSASDTSPQRPAGATYATL